MQEWSAPIKTDLLGTLHGIQHATEAMRRRGGGAILNVSSTSAFGHGPYDSNAPDYDTAKIGVVRLTTSLGRLRESASIRVNCLAPDWVATPEVRSYFESLPPEQRKDPRVPPVLTSLDEIAQAAFRLIDDESLAGRVLVWWSGRQPGLIASDDRGYRDLEPYFVGEPPASSSN
jgi:NAD(P)-dependent dehydrogenase (short-subunit alcohol dehydrogenase family)